MPRCESKKKFDDVADEVQCEQMSPPEHGLHKAHVDGWEYEWYDTPD